MLHVPRRFRPAPPARLLAPTEIEPAGSPDGSILRMSIGGPHTPPPQPPVSGSPPPRTTPPRFFPTARPQSDSTPPIPVPDPPGTTVRSLRSAGRAFPPLFPTLRIDVQATSRWLRP